MMSAKTQYNELGFVVVRNLLSDTEIVAIAEQVNDIFDAWMSENKADVVEHQLVNIHSLTSQQYFEKKTQDRVAFFNAISPLKLTNLLQSMFGSQLYLHNTQLFFNPLDNQRTPYWHRDMQYSSLTDDIQRAQQNKLLCLHIRIPLVQEQGVEVIPGTHKRWDTKRERDVRLSLNGHHNNESLENATLLALDVGDVLIFSAQMIHRGNYHLNESRKALDLCIGEYHPLTFEFFDHKMMPTATEIEKITNNRWYRCAKKLQLAHK